MSEAGWLLLLLFLGCCSLITVAVLWRPFTLAQHQRFSRTPYHLTSSNTTLLPSEEKAADETVDWLELLITALHLLVIGHSRGGKTSVIHELALRWVKQGYRVLVCDLDAAPGLWVGCDVYGYGNDSTAINSALLELGTEVERRRTLRGNGTRRSFPPLYIIIDEYQDVTRSKDCPTARELVEDILRRGGKLDIHLTLGVQDKQVKTMGFEGQGDLRRNFTFILEVRKDRAEKRWAKISEGSDEKAVQTYLIPSLPDLDQLVEQAQTNLSPIPHSDIAQEQEIAPILSSEEIAHITLAIARGIHTKTSIVKSMPGYSSRRHKLYAALYDTLAQAIQASSTTQHTTLESQAVALAEKPIVPAQLPNDQHIQHPEADQHPQSVL